MGVGILVLQVAMLLAAPAFDWAALELASAGALGAVSLAQGGLLLAAARRLSALGREESEQVPRATRQLFASGVCFGAAGLLLFIGLFSGVVGLGVAALCALLLGFESGLMGLLQVRTLYPGRPEDLRARLAARVQDAASASPDPGASLLRVERVTAEAAGLLADVVVGDRPGTLRVDLARLPIVAELRVPLAALPDGLRVVHADVAGPDAEPLGDPILDGLVSVEGPLAGRQCLVHDHGAVLALVRGWPGSSIEQGGLVLRVAQPEAERVGLLARLRGRGASNLLDVESLLATLQEAIPSLRALAGVLDPAPSAQAQSMPSAPSVQAASEPQQTGG